MEPTVEQFFALAPVEKSSMMSEQNPSTLTTKQLIERLWEVKGTPEAQPLYAELRSRPPKFTLKPDDPDWEAKMSDHLQSTFSPRELMGKGGEQ